MPGGVSTQSRIAMVSPLAQAASRSVRLLNHLVTQIRKYGVLKTAHKISRRLRLGTPDTPDGLLRHWFDQNYPSAGHLAEQRQRKWPASAPTISLIAHVRSRSQARRILRNLNEQTYGRWQLILIGASGVVSKAAARHRTHGRVMAVATEGARVASGLERARQLADGDFVGVIGATDLLTPHALAEMAQHLLGSPQCDVVYCDEACITPLGRPHTLRLKPGWSPEMLLGFNYIGRLCLIRRELLQHVGGYDARFGAAQEYEALLRVGESATRIERLPQCLYFRRARFETNPKRGDTISNDDEEFALKEHLRRLGHCANVQTLADGLHRVEWPLMNPPIVSIIIPTLNNPTVLKQCVEDLRQRTAYPRMEIILVDNNSSDAETLAYYDELCASRAATVVPYHRPFNYSQACNLGARHANGELLLFLNNDVSVIDPGWLEEMVRFALRPGVGCVGTKLLYPDGSVQHAGTILGMHLFGMIYNGVPQDYRDEFGTPNMYRNVMATMGACQMVSRVAFDAVGGFDERYRIATSDSLLCLHIHKAGWRTVYTPHAALYHHEGYTRGKRNPIEDLERAAREIGDLDLLEDPYFHPALSSLHAVPKLRLSQEPPPREMLSRQIDAFCRSHGPVSQADAHEILSGGAFLSDDGSTVRRAG